MKRWIWLASLGGVFVMFFACSKEERDFSSSSSAAGGGGAGAASASSGSGASNTSSGTGGTGGSGGGMVDPAAACAAYASAVCAGYASCLPVALETLYGTETTCIDRFTLFCSFVIGADGTSWSAAGISACADAFNATTCPEFVTATLAGGPDACLPMPGVLADGHNCADSGQCQSAYCKKLAGGECGLCTPLSGQGSPCDTKADCMTGLGCAAGQCVPEATSGQPCVMGQIPCAAPLICRNGYCEPPLELGDACAPAMSLECFFIKGLYCHPQTLMCVEAPVAGANQPCGFVGNEFVYCAASGTCDAPPGGMGTCIPAAADGAACDAMQGPACMLPSVCIQGTCAQPDGSLCP